MDINLAVLISVVAVAAAVFAVWRERQMRKKLEKAARPPASVEEYGSPVDLPAEVDTERRGPIRLCSVHIRNFKNIEELELDLRPASKLEGNWTCIAGINGAGKSSILQAICLLLLGERWVREIGTGILERLPRSVDGETLEAELRAVVAEAGEEHNLYIPLSQDGLDERKLRSHPDYVDMVGVWERMRKETFVSYGASRNLSTAKDTRFQNMGEEPRRQMTLFDSMTQIASVDVLLKGGEDSKPALLTLHKLLKQVLDDEQVGAAYQRKNDRLVFNQSGAQVGAIDLPDGFRSTVAWLADLCAIWHQTAPESERKSGDPSQISGVVLLDEIGLHLHASLARAIVPRLRRALPNVQFIITTHSPLVLGSFDRAELILLEATESGVRKRPQLDRQVFAFSSDEIYESLLDTLPHSAVLDEKEEEEDPDLALYYYQSPTVNEQEARKLREEKKRLLEELGYKEGDEM